VVGWWSVANDQFISVSIDVLFSFLDATIPHLWVLYIK